jgi:hypothetical protein
LAAFPTDFHQDWQWADIVSEATAVCLDELPRTLQPIVQPIDDWNSNRRLGLVWECRVGPGRLLVCSANLERNLDQRPAARQLRTSLLHYMSGKHFAPRSALELDSLQRLLQPATSSGLSRLGARILQVDSEDRGNGNVADHAIDGNPETIWHTRWDPTNDPMPHQLVIDLGREMTIAGITYLPRLDMPNGRIADCEVYCGNDPGALGTITARAKWTDTDQLQALRFERPVNARYLRLVVRSEVNGNPFTSIAEIDLLPAK